MKQTDVIQFVTALQRYYADLSNHKNPSQRDDRLSALADTLGCPVEDISEPAGFAKVVENVKSNLNKLVSYGAEETTSSSDREPADKSDAEAKTREPIVDQAATNAEDAAPKGNKQDNANKISTATNEIIRETQSPTNKRVDDTSENTVSPKREVSDNKSDSEEVSNQPLFDTNIFRSIL